MVIAHKIGYLDTIFNTQFLVDVVDVVFNSMGGNVELLLNVCIAHTLENKLNYFLLTIGYFVDEEKIF